MSLGYAVFVELDVPYNVSTVKFLLKKGADLGFIYYQFILGKMNLDSDPLDIDMATESVMIGDSENGLNCLTIRINDTCATLHLWESGENIKMMFTDLCYDWSKTYHDKEFDLDVGRYGKLMLNLVSDFKIKKMEIRND